MRGGRRKKFKGMIYDDVRYVDTLVEQRASLCTAGTRCDISICFYEGVFLGAQGGGGWEIPSSGLKRKHRSLDPGMVGTYVCILRGPKPYHLYLSNTIPPHTQTSPNQPPPPRGLLLPTHPKTKLPRIQHGPHAPSSLPLEDSFHFSLFTFWGLEDEDEMR